MTITCQLDTYLPAFTLMLETERAPRTVEGYTQSLQNFLRYAKGNGLPSEPQLLTAEHVRLFLRDLAAQGRSANTLRQYIASLRRFFKWLIVEGEIADNPMDRIHMPRAPERIVTPLEIDELRRLKQAAQQRHGREALRDLALLLILEDTGARASEITGLTLDRVDWRLRTFRLAGKGNRERLVVASGTTMRALAAYLKARRSASETVFITRLARPMNRNSLLQVLRRLALRAGVEGVHTHRFRHTFADQWLGAGGQEGDLQTILGHSTPTMTRKYTNARKNERALEAMRGLSLVERLK
jgi:site-specific recombinase XerD